MGNWLGDAHSLTVPRARFRILDVHFLLQVGIALVRESHCIQPAQLSKTKHIQADAYDVAETKGEGGGALKHPTAGATTTPSGS